jgi:hypothetical protein
MEREMEFPSQEPESSAPVGPTYRAFLLRCWREAGAGPGDPAAWRFRLVEPGDAEAERGFASLEALMAFLRRELEAG